MLPVLVSNKYSAFPVLICVLEHGTGRAAVLFHLRTHRFPGGPVQGQFLVVSAPCKVSQRERAVKPGSCHDTQHLKMLWKTNSPFECCLKIFLLASMCASCFFLSLFIGRGAWLWWGSVWEINLSLESTHNGNGASDTVPCCDLRALLQSGQGCLGPPNAGAASLPLGWACAEAGSEESACL